MPDVQGQDKHDWHSAINNRNITVIGHYGQGKSTLRDIIISECRPVVPGDLWEIQDSTGPRLKPRSKVTSVFFEAGTYDSIAIRNAIGDAKKLFVNIIDPPGHATLASEVSASLRLCDGALVVVDCLETPEPPTSIIERALAERVKPVLAISKLDRVFSEPQLSKETLYALLARTVDGFNDIITAHPETMNLGDSDFQVDPGKGTVVFSSAAYRWGFTLRQFAKKYAAKFGVDEDKIMEKLWGDHYYDPIVKKWTKKEIDAEGRPLERGFNQLVLEPIFKVMDAATNSNDRSHLDVLLTRLHVTLTTEERERTGERLGHTILRKFLPIGEALLQEIVIHLPSPVSAQSYRTDILYEGSTSDEAFAGMKACDPSGTLVVFVSNMIPGIHGGNFFALGRVFSGTVRRGTEVRILGPKYHPDALRSEDIFKSSITSVGLLVSDTMIPVDECPAGNFVCLANVDKFLLTSGTITALQSHTNNIKAIRFTAPPVVQVAVETDDPSELPRLISGLECLSHTDASMSITVAEDGMHYVVGLSEQHLQSNLKDLKETYCAGTSLKVSPPSIIYRETVKTKSRITALAKSQNKHNRLFATASPIDPDLLAAIENGDVSAHADYRRRANILTDQFGWDPQAKRIWAFGPHTAGPNLLVDVTKGVHYLHEIKDACVAGFQWATLEGVCAEEPMRGVQCNIVDVFLNGDAIHRGSGQIIPPLRRVVYAASLLAEPALQEPMLFLEMDCDTESRDILCTYLNQHRGRILGERPLRSTVKSLTRITAHIPVSESFNLDSELDGNVDFRIVQSGFDHWETMETSPLQQGSKVAGIVREIRIRKGLNPDIPALDKYLDKL